LKKGRNIIAAVAGTNYPHISAQELSNHCENENIRLVLFDNADHRLEVPGDIEASAEILKQMAALYSQTAKIK